MTTTSNPSTTNPPRDGTWHVHQEFRTGSVFIRMLIPDSHDEYRIVIATSREGLDEPGALTIDHAWDLHRALRAVGLIAEILESATGGEEWHVSQELLRLGVSGIDEDGTFWERTDPEPTAEAQLGESVPASSEERAREGFEIDGIAGCVEPMQGHWIGDAYCFRFANSVQDLKTPSRSIAGRSLNALVRAAWAASIMLEIERGDAGTRALGYRELTRLGVRTFTIDEENKERAFNQSS